MTGLGMIPTCKPSLETSEASRFRVHFAGTNYNLAPVEKKYTCDLCKDTEIIEIRVDGNGMPVYGDCPCKAKKNAARKLKSSGLAANQLNYKLSDYKVNKGNRDMFEGVKRYLTTWPELIDSNKECKGFFLVGNAGIGKTMLSCIIAKDMLDKGIGVVFVSSADILAELRQAQFSKDTENIEAKIETLAKAPALILDDIGKEKPTEWVQSMYYRLIDLRYRNNLLTGFNSNYLPKELEERLGDFGGPTVSRIMGLTRDNLFHAQDIDHRIRG